MLSKKFQHSIKNIFTKENLMQAVAFAKEFAVQTGAVIAITGEIDIVAVTVRNKEAVFCHTREITVTGRLTARETAD